MNKIEYKDFIYDEAQIMDLYLDNKWYAYTNDKESLFRGIKESSYVLGAYDGEKLIGLLRTVSDNNTFCYILDILINREYHRKGIGTVMMNMAIKKYSHCRAISLATDNTVKQKEFYKSLGFQDYNDIECVGFSYNHKHNQK